MLMLPRTCTQAAVIFSFLDEFRRYPSFRTSLSAMPWLSEILLINLLPQSSIFRALWCFCYQVTHRDIPASEGWEVWMGSPDPWLSQQFIKKSTESVTTFRKKHFVHIYLTYLQCKINYRLQRNPVIFLANQNILKALVVSEGHVSQLSLLTFRSSSLLCLCVNFKKFAITSPADRFCPGLHRGQKYDRSKSSLESSLFAQVGDAEAWDLFIFLAGSTETHRENMIQPGGAVSYYSIHLL